MNKFLIGALALSLTLPLAAEPPLTPTSLAPLNGHLRLFVTPDAEGHQVVIEAIKQAKRSIHMVMFHLTDKAVVRALVKARSQGKEVKVILDRASLRTPRLARAARDLRAGGVEVHESSPEFTISHEKAMLVDGKKTLIMSMNMTRTFARTRDYGLVVESPTVAQEFDEVFAADWQDRRAFRPIHSCANLVYSPLESGPRLQAMIRSARRTLVCTTENLGDVGILEALREAARRGVRVRVLVPEMDLDPNPRRNEKYVSRLRQGGVDARVMPAPSTPQRPYMHAKIILVDGSMGFIGSINLSHNSIARARELGVLFSDSEILRSVLATFEADWSEARRR